MRLSYIGRKLRSLLVSRGREWIAARHCVSVCRPKHSSSQRQGDRQDPVKGDVPHCHCCTMSPHSTLSLHFATSVLLFFPNPLLIAVVLPFLPLLSSSTAIDILSFELSSSYSLSMYHRGHHHICILKSEQQLTHRKKQSRVSGLQGLQQNGSYQIHCSQILHSCWISLNTGRQSANDVHVNFKNGRMNMIRVITRAYSSILIRNCPQSVRLPHNPSGLSNCAAQSIGLLKVSSLFGSRNYNKPRAQ